MPHPDPDAFPILAMLVALSLSTCAQCQFGFDPPTALARYKLLPLAGWRIVAAKDAAFLACSILLTLPLDPVAGLTFSLTALAIGHIPSIGLRLPQHRWRFTSGRLVYGVLQCVLGAAFAHGGAPFLALALIVYAVSLWWSARRILTL